MDEPTETVAEYKRGANAQTLKCFLWMIGLVSAIGASIYFFTNRSTSTRTARTIARRQYGALTGRPRMRGRLGETRLGADLGWKFTVEAIS